MIFGASGFAASSISRMNGLFFPLNLDEFQRPVANLLAIGDNSNSHGVLIEVARSGKSKNAVTGGDIGANAAVFCDIRIIVFKDIPHADERFRLACIYTCDSGMRIGRSEDFRVQHPRKMNISCIGCLSGDPIMGILTGHVAFNIFAGFWDFPSPRLFCHHSPSPETTKHN